MMWWIADARADDLDDQIAIWVRDPAEVRRLHEVVDTQATTVERDLADVGDTKGVGDALRRAVLANLTAKSTAAEPFALSPDQIEREVIGYEAFKLESYVTSGVFPKRYFGYLDERRDTAEHERRLRAAVPRARQACNAWLAAQGDDLRVTDAEIAVTFLAESGALYMGARTDKIDQLHPVFDVGLDNLASGDADLGALRDDLDRSLGTDLGGLVAWVDVGAARLPVPTSVPEDVRYLQSPNGEAGPFPYLVRYMTFEEAIAGTALMWVWEKRIAERAVDGMRGPALHERPLDQQFIIGSLVYNSGKAHSPDRWEQIRTFRTGEWVYATSERNAKSRWRLNVLAPPDALGGLRAGGGYPEQPTAWLAVYHILQRYGAWTALHRFSDTFDATDAFLPGPAAPDPAWFPAVAAAEIPPETTLAAEVPSSEPVPTAWYGCGCATGSSGGPLGALLALALTACSRSRCRTAS